MTGIRSTVLLCIVFITIVLGAFVFNTTRVKTMSFEDLAKQGSIMLPKPRAIAEIDLQADDGSAFTEANLVSDDTAESVWTFVFFGFTNCPDICPTSMAEMGKAYNDLTPEERQSFQGVLVSVDPERDDLRSLGEYARAFSPSFIGVTGSIPSLATFATQVNAAFAKVPGGPGEPYQMDHTGNLVIVNPRGHYHGFIKMPHARAKLVETFRALRATF